MTTLAKQTTRISGYLMLALGLAASLAWLVGVPAVLQLHPEFATLKFSGAVCTAMFGGTLLFAVLEQRRRALVLGTLVFAISGLSLLQYLLGVDFGFDQLIVKDRSPTGTSHPGRMAPNLALGLLLASMAVFDFFMRRRSALRPLVLSALGLVVFALGSSAAVGYLTGLESAYGWGSYTRLSVLGAIALIAAGVGVSSLAWSTRSMAPVQLPELWRTITVYTFASVAIIALLSAMFAVLPLYNHLRESRSQELALEVTGRAAMLQNVVARFRRTASLIRNSFPEEITEQALAGVVPLSTYQSLAEQRLAAFAEGQELLRGLMRVDAHGRVPVGVGMPIPKSVWPAASQLPQLLDWGVAGPIEIGGKWYMVAREPLMTREGSLLGADLALFSVDQIEAVIDEMRHYEGASRAYLAVREEGEPPVLYTLSRRTGDLRLVHSLPPYLQGAMERLLGHEQLHIEHIVLPRSAVVATAAPVGDTDLSLISAVDSEALFTGTNQQLLRFMLGVLVLALFGATGFYFLVSEALKRAESLQLQVQEHLVALDRELQERRRIQGALALSEARTTTIVANAPDGVLALDGEGNIESFNRAAERMFSAPAREAVGRPISALLPSFDWAARIGALEARDAENDAEDIEAVSREGRRFPCETRLIRSIVDGHTLFTLFLRDLSEERAHEEEVRRSLREKETLLKEIHHRVKNNLQVISSLFNLHARTLKDGLALQVLNESRDRVRSIALMHELLYRSGMLASLNIRSYVEELCASLVRSYGIGPRVQFEAQADALVLDIDRAIPLGLILNELVSNALKHAFPHDRSGTIRVSFSLTDGVYRLEVQDTGVGFSGPLDWHSSGTLGLRLVRSLVAQLDGEVRASSSNGAHFTVSFPAREGDSHNLEVEQDGNNHTGTSS